MKVAVHNHFNARKLCDIEISDAVAAQLAKPPKLKSNRPEDHVVVIASSKGLLRLFNAKVNGADLVVTNTPDAALSAAT